jgi:hypothetical protein
MATKKMTDEEVIEIIESEVQPIRVVIWEEDSDLIFEQKPLTFFGKIEFFSVTGKP